MFRCLALAICFWSTGVGLSLGQEPIDLFSDAPRLTNDFIRIGAWNLRHINIEGNADTFLPGNTREEDFEILYATLAKAIEDLGLDLVAITEVKGDDRVAAIRDALNVNIVGSDPWQSEQTDMEFGFSGAELQLGLLWNSSKVTINPNETELLVEQRQSENLRAPWLIPVAAGALEFDLIVVHLKAGQESPQEDEVDSLESFMRQRLSSAGSRHLILCGDYNIRADNSTGRGRLKQLMVPYNGRNLMRLLTVTSIPPPLDEWSSLRIEGDDIETDLLPGSYVNLGRQDSLLDHMAISSSLEEVFDHPIRVTLAADNKTDLRPAIEIVRPMQAESDFRNITDHMPVVLTLRTTSSGELVPEVAGTLRISGVLPNPFGDDREGEAVRLFNPTDEAISLAGWRIADSTGRYWQLDENDGSAPAQGTVEVTRRQRPMALNNDGDTAILLDPTDAETSRRAYGDAVSGHWFLD